MPRISNGAVLWRIILILAIVDLALAFITHALKG